MAILRTVSPQAGGFFFFFWYVKNCSMEFNETQRFRPWWMWLIISIVFIFPVAVFVYYIVTDPAVTYAPPTNGVAIAVAVISFLLLFLFLSVRFDLAIDDAGVSYRFFPVHLKMQQVSWKDIQHAEIRETPGIRRASGIRYRAGGDTLIGLASKAALSLHLDSGKKLMLGTRRPDELKRLLDHLRS
jgi:hypothetical protein